MSVPIVLLGVALAFVVAPFGYIAGYLVAEWVLELPGRLRSRRYYRTHPHVPAHTRNSDLLLKQLYVSKDAAGADLP